MQAEENVVELHRDRAVPVNPPTFDELFLDQHDRLYRALYFVTGSREDAEELMQDAFVKLWERWDSISEIDDPVAWLFRVSLNGFRMRRRRAAVAARRLMPIPIQRDPGTYVINTLDPDFDASHRITIDVPDGYESFGGFSALKLGAIQTSVSTWVVGNVYADGCDWIGKLVGRPSGSSVDGLVGALASQRGLRASTPTDVTVDGFAGKYLERTVPAGTSLADCDGGEFRTWLDPTRGLRYLEPGQLDQLWIVDVDGVPLVIDAALDAGSSAQDRAELIRMVESISIDPR